MTSQQHTTKLSVWESACIITGYGIGGGVMAMPYLTQMNGIVSAAIILLLAYGASIILHLMIAEVSMKNHDSQIVSIFSRYLFQGKFQKGLTTGFFIIMSLVLFTNLAAYISGAAEILTAMLGIPLIIARLLFYVVAALVVLFGLKAVGVSEKLAIAAIYVMVGILAIASFTKINQPLPLAFGTPNQGLAFFGMAMFAFSAFFSVPQAVSGLGGDKKKVTKAVIIGISNNLILITIIVICALLSSSTVTEVAMVGWSKGIGLWAEVVGSIFTIVAMLTTYWSISLALSEIVREQTHLSNRLCWLIATLPSLILTFLGLGGFMEFMRLAGGLVAILIALLVVPSFRKSRKDPGPSILGRLGGTPMQIVIIIAYIFMAVGNVVTY